MLIAAALLLAPVGLLLLYAFYVFVFISHDLDLSWFHLAIALILARTQFITAKRFAGDHPDIDLVRGGFLIYALTMGPLGALLMLLAWSADQYLSVTYMCWIAMPFLWALAVVLYFGASVLTGRLILGFRREDSLVFLVEALKTHFVTASLLLLLFLVYSALHRYIHPSPDGK